MKALVTGGGGQLARALSDCAPAGIALHAPDRRALDISDEAAVAAMLDRERPDLLINAAAYTAVDRAESETEIARRINGDAPAFLARAAAQRGIRLLHISTDFVFDGMASRPYRPDDATAPLGRYGASKLAGERGVSAAGGDTLIVRTAWVYAAGGANFMETMLRLMAERAELRVVQDQIGTPTHAASLAAALWRMAAGSGRGIVHYTDAGVASWYDFAVAIAEEARAAGLPLAVRSIIPIDTIDYPTPAKRPAFSVLDKAAGWALAGGAARHWRQELRDAIARRMKG